MFFKKRAIQVSVVKTSPKKTEDPESTMATAIGESSARLVNELAKDFVKYAAGAIIGVVVLYKAADTLSQIAVKKTKSADNDN
jgi:hypothetical protein